MSITFRANLNQSPTSLEAFCWTCEAVTDTVSAEADTREDFYRGYMLDCKPCPVCGDTSVSIDYVYPVEPVELNVSNGNAVMLIERLGLEFDYSGAIDPDVLIGMAMVANVGRTDEGTESVQDGNMVFCGLPAGYYESKASQLVDVALQAKGHGVEVIWS